MNSIERYLAGLVCLALGACQPSTPGTSTPEVPGDEPALSASGDATLTDATLLGDGLVAPAAPQLTITATAGELQFDWSSEVAADTITIYRYDAATGRESALDEVLDTGSSRHSVPVQAHKTRWGSEQYRVELCTELDCISSARVSIDALLPRLLTQLAPATSTRTNRFGGAVAVNATGNIITVAAPGDRYVSVFFELPGRWHEAQQLTSPYFAIGGNRQFSIAMSADGNTLAVGSVSTVDAPTVVVFERIGEAWIETGLILPTGIGEANALTATDTLRLLMSEDGDTIAIANQARSPATDLAGNSITVYRHDGTAFARTHDLSLPLQHARLPTIAANAALDSIYTLSNTNGVLHLHHFSTSDGSTAQQRAHTISMMSVDTDTSLVSHDTSHAVAIAGWESSGLQARTPVVWHYRASSDASRWFAHDSVRLPVTDDTHARIRLAANASLGSIAAGWQGRDNAELLVFRTDDAAGDGWWRSVFALPDAFGTLAKSAFTSSVAISADDSALLIGDSNPARIQSGQPGGRVLLFR